MSIEDFHGETCECEQLRSDLAAAKDERDVARSELDECRSELASVTERMHSLQERADDADDRLDRVTAERDQYVECINKSDSVAERGNLVGEIKRLEAECEHLERRRQFETDLVCAAILEANAGGVHFGSAELCKRVDEQRKLRANEGSQLQAAIDQRLRAEKAESEANTLRARVAEYDSRLSAVMPPDFKDWHQNSKSERPTVAAWCIENLRVRVAELEEHEKWIRKLFDEEQAKLAGAEQRNAELVAALRNIVEWVDEDGADEKYDREIQRICFVALARAESATPSKHCEDGAPEFCCWDGGEPCYKQPLVKSTPAKHPLKVEQGSWQLDADRKQGGSTHD